MNKFNKNKKIIKVFKLLCWLILFIAIGLWITTIITKVPLIKDLAFLISLFVIILVDIRNSSLGYINGFKDALTLDKEELNNLGWEEVDALLLNHHNFYADDIAWGSYGWPAPAGDKFDIYVWERRSDGARYITVEIKNYIWFICYQTLHMIYLVPSGDSEIPHDTSLTNKEFLGIINEISRNSCIRLFNRNGNMTLYVNGRWYEDWERFEYKVK